LHTLGIFGAKVYFAYNLSYCNGEWTQLANCRSPSIKCCLADSFQTTPANIYTNLISQEPVNSIWVSWHSCIKRLCTLDTQMLTRMQMLI